jgi:hypothetical protein
MPSSIATTEYGTPSHSAGSQKSQAPDSQAVHGRRSAAAKLSVSDV